MQTDPISNSTNASLTLASRGMINNVNIAFIPRQVVDTSNPSTFVNNKEPNPSIKVSISFDALNKLSSEQQSFQRTQQVSPAQKNDNTDKIINQTSLNQQKLSLYKDIAQLA